MLYSTKKLTKGQKYKNNGIPVTMSEETFNIIVLPHIRIPTNGPDSKISYYKIFSYILKILYQGFQWEHLPIDKDENGRPEIHYSNVFKFFQRWSKEKVFEKLFLCTVELLQQEDKLDTSVIHGDGTCTVAKKGGDNLGHNGHKHHKGDKTISACDRNCNIIAPFIPAAGNRNESPLFIKLLPSIKSSLKSIGIAVKGCIMSLDGVYDSKKNRKAIFNAGMIPNINENKRNRKKSKPGPARLFNEDIYDERFETIERIFSWEDKFKRLLIRFERISEHHYGFKNIAYALINLRHFI